MKNDPQKNYKSLAFFLLIGVSVSIMHFSYMDFSQLSPDRQKVVIILESRPVKKDTSNLLKTVQDSVGTQTQDSIEVAKIRQDSLAPSGGVEEIEVPTTIAKKEVPVDNYFESLCTSALDSNRQRRNKPVIRYFTKPKDADKVYSLKKYGYYIHERTSPGLQDYSSNAIYYGDSILKNDLELIIYSLLNQGVDIKNISPSKYKWKYNAIEIGTDTTILDSPNIAVSEIRIKLSDL